MKKLNRKGFTLVELLAVIIILAIVVGITIPAVLTTTSNAKKKAFETAASTTADWVDRQYQVYSTGLSSSGLATLDPNFIATAACGTNVANCTASAGKKITDAKFMAAAGLNTKNVSEVLVKINTSTGRSCVTLTAKSDGDYAGVVSGDKISAGAC